MILQVNKKKKKDKKMIQSIDLTFESEVEELINQEKQSLFSSENFGRKSGKTTLIARLAKKYNLPIITRISAEKNIYKHHNVYSIERDFGKLNGINVDLVLVDDISEYEVELLGRAGLKVIGFVSNVENNKKELYEDYIEVSCVRKFEGYIVAQINQTQIHLFFDKEFKRDYDSYSEDNLDFLIDSAYLLDDTGKTIRKLM